MEAVMYGEAGVQVDGKGGLRRTAAARAIRVLGMLRRRGVTAQVVGSLTSGRFTDWSDVDFLVTECPRHLKYTIEAAVEDIMLDIPFDVVYRDEAVDPILSRMESQALDARKLARVPA
jgi:predicted nucleotidyltransferase